MTIPTTSDGWWRMPLMPIGGQPGPLTRASPLTLFANHQQGKGGNRSSPNRERAQLDAVASVESAGGGFQPDGLPKALYERH